MMGANWRPDPYEHTVEKFAWWPVRSSWSKKRIWLKKYVETTVYHDSEMSNPIRSNYWTYLYTQNEYLMYLLRKEKSLE